MGYDISLINKKTGKIIDIIDTELDPVTGETTYVLGETTAPWLNITYNYDPYFYKVLGKKGIGSIYGKTAKQSIPILEKAISKLKDVDDNYWKPTERNAKKDVDEYSDDDYWNATEGNAKKALQLLLKLAKMAPPDSTWKGY